MPEKLEIEALILDDSFINFCLGRNHQDILFWEEYIRSHPQKRKDIEEAIGIVRGLKSAFGRHQGEGGYSANANISPRYMFEEIAAPSGRKWQRTIGYIAAAAVLIAAIWGAIFFFDTDTSAASPHNTRISTTGGQMFMTANAEKKQLVLPDSTRLLLGAGSTLRIAPEFGNGNRSVYLTGEALFDVTHNAELPFIVHCENYDVKVLGTLFNVRAYAGDEVSETSLMQGKVEISVRSSPEIITLEPNQKAIIRNKPPRAEGAVHTTPSPSQQPVKVTVAPISYNRDSIAVETAWTHNRLEIINENFIEIKHKLERWYDVQLVITDEEVAGYTFTGTFTNETIKEVLDALQSSYHFTYKIDERIITISK